MLQKRTLCYRRDSGDPGADGGTLGIEKFGICPKQEILAEQIQAIEIDTYLVGYKQCAVSDGCLSSENGSGCKILYTVFSRSRFPLRNRRHGAV